MNCISRHSLHNKKGMTLIELMVVMAILVVVIAAALTLLSTLTQRSAQESARSRTNQTGFISDLILIRDIAMAGYGVPVEINGQFVPIGGLLPGGVNPNNTGPNGSDQLMIKGGAISSGANDYFKWGYNTQYINNGTNIIFVRALPWPGLPSYSPDVQNLFTLSRANYAHPFERGDRVVFLNVETKQLLSNQVYQVNRVSPAGLNINVNTDFNVGEFRALIFSLGGMNVANFDAYLNNPNNFTGYRLGGGRQPQCAPGTLPLLRVYGGARDPILDCVLDFQVQFGLIDPNNPNNGNITWVNDITAISSADLEKQLKLVRVFIVKQMGKRDPKYWRLDDRIPVFSVNSDGTVVNARASIQLTNAQRQYHWRLITLDVPLREL